jgi:hypothetical protein
MIAALRFTKPVYDATGRALGDATFVPRSTLPLSAACLVANGVREALSRLLARELDVEVLEPVVPDASERRVLLDGATVYRVRGRICDGFVVFRSDDARRLAALAFGEHERSERDPLSAIERATLERIAANLVPLCNTLCGTLGPVVRETAERAACDVATYFEVRTSAAPRVAIGFALSRDPAEDISGRITLADLSEVEVGGTVTCGFGSLSVPAFSRLAPGVTLPLDTPLGGHGVLRFGDVAFARGTCGVNAGRTAMYVAAENDARASRPAA